MRQLAFHFLRWCPGVIGLLLRQRFYPFLLRHCGRGVLIGRGVEFINPRCITIADNVIVNDGSCLDAAFCRDGETGISLGKGVFIGAFTVLSAGPGSIRIGEGSNIGSRCRISAAADIQLADHVLLAGYCSIGDVSAPAAERQPSRQTSTEPSTGAPISIGRGCWLGLRCQVNPGVSIGEGTIVGAHAFVGASLPEYAIAVGRPAEIIRLRP